MQLCTHDDVINKENADSMWTRPSWGDNDHYSWILGT